MAIVKSLIGKKWKDIRCITAPEAFVETCLAAQFQLCGIEVENDRLRITHIPPRIHAIIGR